MLQGQAGTTVVAGISPSPILSGPVFITVTGTGFSPGAAVALDGVQLQTAYVSPTQLIAEGNVSPGMQSLTVSVSGAPVSAPFPVTVRASQMNPYSAARFLEQASWGPSAATVAHVQEVGFEQYLEEQFAESPSLIPDQKSGSALPPVQANFFYNAMNGKDQLRQRVAFVLNEICVVSGKKLNLAEAFVPYLRLLQAEAFGNYYDLLRDLTFNPAMGNYLNMANNGEAHPAVDTVPNENYARELMQLFSIGEVLLNSDGTPQLDGAGHTIPAYSQAVVADTARALTGWTYAPESGSTPEWRSPSNYAAPMVAIEDHHDAGAKTALDNLRIPAGQTAAQDVEAVLRNVFQHANTGPFLAKQFIQHLVSSNPTPAYVRRVAAVFNDDGTGTRGNLRAMVRAILLDPEARAGDYPGAPSAEGGHLSEPVLFLVRLLRALNASVPADNSLSLATSWMGQALFYPATVFNYFSPSYQLPGSTQLAPEFQIHSGTYAMNRVNVVSQVVFGGGQPFYGFTLDASAWVNMAANPGMLLDWLNLTLMHGNMSSRMRETIQTAMNGTSGQQWQARNALLLAASSPQYQVIH